MNHLPVRILPGFLSNIEVGTLVHLSMAHDRAWSPGRQNTGYVTASFVQEPNMAELIQRSLAQLGPPVYLAHDAYLIRYPPGVGVPEHIDPQAKTINHHRLNALLLDGGGQIIIDGKVVHLKPRDAVVFRPDLLVHEVKPGEGVRLIWSVGCTSSVIGSRVPAQDSQKEISR
jgi:hypothetical protein